MDEPSKKTKMEWLERKKANHESILACVMEANRKVFEERENGQLSNTAEISSKMKSEKFLLDLETFRNN